MHQTSGGGNMNFSINLSSLFEIHVLLGKALSQSFSLLTVCSIKIYWLLTYHHWGCLNVCAFPGWPEVNCWFLLVPFCHMLYKK